MGRPPTWKERNMGNVWLVVSLVGAAALLAFSLWWSVQKYRECREFGHSVMYCIGR